MNAAERLVHRLETEAKAGKESFARELAGGMLLLRSKGNCRCGLMLTERDQNRDKDTYSCPRCGRSGLLMDPAAGSAAMGRTP